MEILSKGVSRYTYRPFTLAEAEFFLAAEAIRSAYPDRGNGL